MEIIKESTTINKDAIEEEMTITMVKEIEIEKEPAKMAEFIPNLDVCFMIDCTSSMQSYIDRSKNKIKEIIEEVKQQYPESEIHVGVVAYRDVGDTSRFEVFQFSPNIPEAKVFIEKLRAMGGGDTPEDVNGGFQQALYKLEWQGQARMLVHIADAPCHGKEFHTCGDSYPNGHTDDKDWSQIFKDIVDNRIDYLFLKIGAVTDKMFARFKEIADAQGATEKSILFKQEQISNIEQVNTAGSLFGGLTTYAPMPFRAKVSKPKRVAEVKTPRTPRSVSRKERSTSRRTVKAKDSKPEIKVTRVEEEEKAQTRYWTRSKWNAWREEEGKKKRTLRSKSRKASKKEDDKEGYVGSGYWTIPVHPINATPLKERESPVRRVRKTSASKERERSEERDKRNDTPKKRGRHTKVEKEKKAPKKVVHAPKREPLKKLPSVTMDRLPPGMSAMDEAEYFAKLLSKEMKDSINRKKMEK